MRQSALLLCFLLVSVLACGTAQVGDRLILEGKEYFIDTNPLRPFLELYPERHPRSLVQKKWRDGTILPISTANWRGYVATWEVRDDRLFLKDIEVQTDSDKTTSARDLVFPAQDQILADWFTGHIIVPNGKLVDYVHMGYASTYEKYIILRVEGGIVTRRWKATAKEFAKFRAAQFEAFKKTVEFEEALEQSRKRAADAREEFNPARAEEFIRRFYSERYLSAVYDAAPAPPQP